MSFLESIAKSNPLTALYMKAGIPQNIHIDVTSRCNLKCVHCYVLQGRKDALSTDDITGFLDQAASMGVMILTFSGGEPFLRGDIFKILAHARQKRFLFRVFTNAVLLDERKIEKLLLLGPLMVGVSVYSMDPAIHDRITKVPGSFLKTRAAVERMAKAGLKIEIKTVVMKSNADGYTDIVSWSQSLGPKVTRKYDIVLTPRIDGGREPLDLMMDDAGRVRLLKSLKLKEAVETAEKRGEELEPDSSGSGLMPDEPVCLAGITGCYLSPDGEVYPCIDWRIPCGNILNLPLKRIWKSKNMKRAKRFKLSELAVCTGCDLLKGCRVCPGINLLHMGDEKTPSPLTCARTRALKEVFG